MPMCVLTSCGQRRCNESMAHAAVGLAFKEGHTSVEPAFASRFGKPLENNLSQSSDIVLTI